MKNVEQEKIGDGRRQMEKDGIKVASYLCIGLWDRLNERAVNEGKESSWWMSSTAPQ